MKLHEICLTEAIDITKSQPINFKGRKFLPVTGDIVGQGVQSRVQQTGLGVVTKTALISPDSGMHDSAIKFLNLILDRQDNPFFPKIYHARLYRDSQGKMKHMILLVQMEKLVPLTSGRIKDVAVHLFQQLGFGKWETDIDELALEIEHLMDRSPEYVEEFLNKSKNPKFKEAVETIMPYIKERGFADLHSGNWMVRLTNHGPQLVIVDPFPPDTFMNYAELVNTEDAAAKK